MCLLHHLAGAFTQKPEQLRDNIGTKAGDLIKRSFDDIDPARLVDYHTHVGPPGTNDRVRMSKLSLDNLGNGLYLAPQIV